jgi:hypothetical protein
LYTGVFGLCNCPRIWGQTLKFLSPPRHLRRFLPLIRPGGLVLDLAAGGGWHSHLLRDNGFAVRPVDRDVSALLPLAGTRGEVH